MIFYQQVQAMTVIKNYGPDMLLLGLCPSGHGRKMIKNAAYACINSWEVKLNRILDLGVAQSCW